MTVDIHDTQTLRRILKLHAYKCETVRGPMDDRKRDWLVEGQLKQFFVRPLSASKTDGWIWNEILLEKGQKL